MNQHRSIFPHLETSTDRNPGGFEAGPTENPEDENVEMDPDENLPWPDQDLIKKWWSARQGNFAKGSRYLLGQPISTESLRLALKNGYQRQRAAAALELTILKPGRPLFEVRAPGFRQQQLLQFRGLSSTPFPKLDPPEGKPNLPLVRSPPQSIHRELGP
jgi:uncharacterized protein (TIGR02270 family)